VLGDGSCCVRRSLTLHFEWSVTAFSGLNGTGKITIAQLASCFYRKAIAAAASSCYVVNFFPVSPADPESSTSDA
jgi:hypothetical protein